MKITRKSRNITAYSELLQYTARYWEELIEEIESEGYEVDSVDKHNPGQWIIAYKNGNEYEIEVTRYIDGTYEIVKADVVKTIESARKARKRHIKSANYRSNYDVNMTYDADMVEDLAQDIFSAVQSKLRNVLTSAEFGFSPSEVKQYSIVEVTNYPDDNNRLHVEVRAEVNYDGLQLLMEALDPVIQYFDSSAYFDAVDLGIIDAYVSVDNVDMDVY